MDRLLDALYDWLSNLGVVPKLVPVRVKKR